MNAKRVLSDNSESKALFQLKEIGIQVSLDLTHNDLQTLKSNADKESQ